MTSFYKKEVSVETNTIFFLILCYTFAWRWLSRSEHAASYCKIRHGCVNFNIVRTARDANFILSKQPYMLWNVNTV